MLFCIVEEKSQDADLDGTLAVLVAGMLYVRRLGFKRVKCQNGGAPFQVFPMERFKCGSVVISLIQLTTVEVVHHRKAHYQGQGYTGVST